jgi:hypothetical protein
VSIANPTPKSSWLIGCSAILATLFPAAIMFGLIAQYGVNVPFWDEWSLISFFEKAQHHSLTFSDFLVQNNEHRIVFPKLVFLLLYRFGLWTPRAAMFSSLFFATLTALGLQWLLWRTLSAKASGSTIIPTFFLVGFLLFSPCQAENWLWGYQLPCFLLNFSLVAGVVTICSDVPFTVQLLLAAICATIATFTGGSGMLLWPLLGLAIFLRRRGKTRAELYIWSCVWLVLALCAIGLYLHNYRKPSWEPPLAASHKLSDYVYYFLAFLGSALGRHADTASLTSATAVGAMLVVIFSSSVIVLALRWNRDLLHASAPWIAIAGFAVLSASMACVTRIGFGPMQALSSRYTTFSLLFPISLIPLVFLSGQALSTKKQFLVGLNLGLWTTFAALFAMTLTFGTKMMQSSFQSRAMGRTALAFLLSIPQKKVLETTVHPDLPYLNIFAPRADALHLLHPPLLRLNILKRLLNSNTINSSCGEVQKIDKSHDILYEITGRATRCDSRCLPDSIIVCYVDPHDQCIPFMLAFPVAGKSEWKASFPATLIPGTGPYAIEARAFNVEPTRVYKLNGQLSFP